MLQSVQYLPLLFMWLLGLQIKSMRVILHCQRPKTTRLIVLKNCAPRTSEWIKAAQLFIRKFIREKRKNKSYLKEEIVDFFSVSISTVFHRRVCIKILIKEIDKVTMPPPKHFKKQELPPFLRNM